MGNIPHFHIRVNLVGSYNFLIKFTYALLKKQEILYLYLRFISPRSFCILPQKEQKLL